MRNIFRLFIILLLVTSGVFSNDAAAFLTGGGIAGPVSVTYVPTVGTAPANVWSVGRNLVSGYSGHLIEVTKPSNQSLTMNLDATGDARVDCATALTFCCRMPIAKLTRFTTKPAPAATSHRPCKPIAHG